MTDRLVAPVAVRFAAVASALIIFPGIAEAQFTRPSRESGEAIATARVASAQTMTRFDTTAGDWSSVVSGIRGRLIVMERDSGGMRQIQIDFEVQNVRESAGPVQIWWWALPRPMLEFELENEQGVAIEGVSPAFSEGNGASWLSLPYASTLRVIVTRQGYKYTSAPNRTVLRPTNGRAWEITSLTPARLYLKAKLAPTPAPDTARVGSNASLGRQQWVGPLSLPRVRITPPS